SDNLWTTIVCPRRRRTMASTGEQRRLRRHLGRGGEPALNGLQACNVALKRLCVTIVVYARSYTGAMPRGCEHTRGGRMPITISFKVLPGGLVDKAATYAAVDGAIAVIQQSELKHLVGPSET